MEIRIFVYQTESKRMHSCNYICIHPCDLSAVKCGLNISFFFTLSLFYIFVILISLRLFSCFSSNLRILRSPPLPPPPPLLAYFSLYYNSVSNTPPSPPPCASSVRFGLQINRHPCFNKVNCDLA